MSLVNLAAVCSHLQNASKARLGLTSIPVSKMHVALMLGLQKQGFISSVTLGGPSPPKPTLLQPEPYDPAKKAANLLKQLQSLKAQTELGALPLPEQTEYKEKMDGLVGQLDRLGFDAEGQEKMQWPEMLRDAYPEPDSASGGALLQAWEAANSGSDESQSLEAGGEAAEGSIQRSGKSLEWSYKEKVPNNPGQRRLWVGLKYWKNEPVLSQMRLISKPTRRIWVNSEDLAKITRGKESAFVKGLTKTGECMFVTTDRGIMEARECVEKKLGGMVLCRVI